jgi:hypothetical protein
MDGLVIAVSCSTTHTFTKQNQEKIQLLTGLGVENATLLKKQKKVTIETTVVNRVENYDF